ncbi:MAG: HlyD family type I secretion periplasmic adaptor subunit [Pseudomonadota bacterium]|nr:HlyD family type I secretion periplasmic adaptor subunit [Pseudomonadota bacterium]
MTVLDFPQPPAPPPDAPPEPEGPPPPKKTSRTAVYVALGALAVFLGWAAFAPLNRGALASGQVETAGRRTVVQNLEGGEVEQILVREGQQVKRGQLLVKLDEEPALLAVQRYQQRLRELEAERAVLIAEQSGAPAPAWPAEWRNTTDPAIRSLMQTWGSAYSARESLRRSQKAVLRQQIEELGVRSGGLRMESQALSDQSALIAEELRDYRTLYEKGLSPKSRVLALERSEAQLRGRKGQVMAAIREGAVSQGELRLKMLQVDQQAREQAATKLSEVEAEYAETLDRLEAAQLSLTRVNIIAPVDGRVLGRPSVTPGGVVRPGDPVVEIVPDGNLVIRANVNPADVDRVKMGAEATLRFTTLGRDAPALKGEVKYISPDAIAREEAPPAFDVRIEVGPEERAKLKLPVTPGMPVEVSIDAGARTALEYFFEPLTRSYRRSFRE